MNAILSMHDDSNSANVGGKAAALMQLFGKGYRIPAFLTVQPTAFHRRGLKRDAKVELADMLAELGPGPYAARSSAQDEDGADHSHAGQFLSILNVSADDIPGACWNVHKSGSEGHVAGYRQNRGLSADTGSPAVIVQQMVNARCAGVAFTADPVSGRRDRIVISATEGLGDRLVNGEVDGETITLDKESLLPLAALDCQVLTAQNIRELGELAVRVETDFGCPQDIEWAFDRDTLYLLQARPVTTVLRDLPHADESLMVFDNSNIVESYPGLVSPLTYSFAQYAYSRVYRAFVRLVGINEDAVRQNSAVFDNMLTRIDGRVYYNLGNWYRALALLPGFSLNRSYMETMMGLNQPLPESLVAAMEGRPLSGIARWREMLRVGGVGIRLLFESARLNQTVAGFYKRLGRALAEPATKLDQRPLSELAQEYRRIESDLLDRWDAPLINDFLCMIGFGASRKLLEKWIGPAGLELHNDVMIGQGDIVSAEPAKRIRNMGRLLEGHEDLRKDLAAGDGSGLASHPALQAEIDSYLAKFSDRCTEELKLESVTLDRDPSPLYMAVSAASGERTTAADDVFDLPAKLRELLPSKPIRRFLTARALSWAKKRVRDRENLRFERTRIFGRARHLLRAVGRQFHACGLLESQDDIYYLTIQEVLGAIEGFAVDSNLAELVRLRKAETQASAGRSDPPERIMVKGAALAGLGAMEASSAPADAIDQAESQTGTGCGAGVVRASARVITDPRTQRLAHGEILVARHTDPGWIAVFTNASAIVVERGSLLSHSAIVAREMGIPCVVGLKNATQWISDGETIEINGGSGEVRKVP